APPPAPARVRPATAQGRRPPETGQGEKRRHAWPDPSRFPFRPQDHVEEKQRDFLPPLHGEGGRSAATTGWEGLVMQGATLDLPWRPHPASPYRLSHPPHEGEGEALAYMFG